MREYEAAKAAYEAQQRELQYQQSTFNPMIGQQQARRGSALEMMQQQISTSKEQEDYLAQALAQIQAKEEALLQEEQRVRRLKEEWESQREHTATAGMEQVAAYQERVVLAASEEQQRLLAKQQELYEQQLEQARYAEQLAEYQRQLEEFHQQQETTVEAEVHRRMSMGGANLAYLNAEDPEQIHEQYQYQLQIAQQQLDALRYEAEQMREVQSGDANIALEKQRNDFLKQLYDQEAIVREQVCFLLLFSLLSFSIFLSTF